MPYEKLLSKMFQLDAGYFLIQCATEEDRESVYKMCGEYRARTPTGCRRCASSGSRTRSSRRWRRGAGAGRVAPAAKHIPVERLGSTDDCGFSPFRLDVKPKHGSPDFARDIAMKKIAARLEGRACWRGRR